MRSPIRFFFILPIVLFILIAFIQLILNGFFAFILWSFVAVVSILVCLPIIIKAEMKYVPIYQIFTLVIAVLIIVIVSLFYDISNYTHLSKDKITILAVLGGFAITTALLYIHGKKAPDTSFDVIHGRE